MSDRPRLLDLFSGAGGSAMGYYRAGFEVIGVDNRPMPRYPFEFHEADALKYLKKHGREFDVIHASPPCQRYSQVNRRSHLKGKEYPDLIATTRQALEGSGRFWVIENVETAPLQAAVRLCGSYFMLPIRRHRIFESNILLFGTPCQHRWQLRSGKRYPTCFQEKGGLRRKSTVVQIYGHTHGVGLWPQALGIDWMNRDEMTQAIPPVYTEFLGKQLLRVIRDD